jgi:hypothetical protein
VWAATTDAALDFRPSPESVCINAGVAIAGLTVDLEGKPVVSNGGQEIGCYAKNGSGSWFGM